MSSLVCLLLVALCACPFIWVSFRRELLTLHAGLKANAATVQAGISQHFAVLHELLRKREEKMQALVEALASEKLGALEAQKQRMDAVVSGCEKAITLAEEILAGDDWTLMTKREHVASQIGHALTKTCQLDADWSEKLQV